MLNIEVIKFEAQDVITASGVAKACAHDGTFSGGFAGGNPLDMNNYHWTCDGCQTTFGGKLVNGTVQLDTSKIIK